MPSINTISVDKLARLIGTPNCPALIDVRTDEDFAADPRLIPGAVRRRHGRRRRLGRARTPAARSSSSARRARSSARAPPPGCAMSGVRAESLEGGFDGLGRGRPAAGAGRQAAAPRRAGPHRLGDARAAEDRPHRLPLADPPLRRSRRGVPVRRAVRGAGRGGPLRRDALRHRGRVLEPPRRALHLRRHGRGVRPRDTGLAAAWRRSCAPPTPRGLDLAPEAPGLLAASLGLSRMYADDLAQLEAGMPLYDAFYRWCRDATDETHNWPTSKRRSRDMTRDPRRSAPPRPRAGSRRHLRARRFRVWAADRRAVASAARPARSR